MGPVITSLQYCHTLSACHCADTADSIATALASDFWSRQNFKYMLELYGDDLPLFLCFASELDLWQHKWKVDSELGSTLNTLEKALDHADCDFFPNIHTFLCIMGTLPVTSCECEHSISMLTEEHNGTGTS